MRVRFGEWVFDSLTRQVARGGEPAHLSPKAFQFLEILLERRPGAVSKHDLQEILWPATFVSESSLAKLAAEVRAGLGDDARHPRFIRTVYGFGFAFQADAREEPHAVGTAPRGHTCRLLWDNREFLLSEGEHLIGRTLEALVWIDSRRVSRRHARILVSSEGATIEDLGSRNGTFVGDRRIESAALADGDEIRVGPARLSFRSGRGISSSSTEPVEK
jgi:DNA-binding winged helix-turn-helix (wHTH) protein